MYCNPWYSGSASPLPMNGVVKVCKLEQPLSASEPIAVTSFPNVNAITEVRFANASSPTTPFLTVNEIRPLGT